MTRHGERRGQSKENEPLVLHSLSSVAMLVCNRLSGPQTPFGRNSRAPSASYSLMPPACSTLTHRFLRGIAAVLLGLIVVTVWAAADEAHFTDSLSPAEQTSMGLTKLSAAQRTALNAQIQHDITLAREGEVSGFATTFTQRRTAAERAAAGLDLLGNDERQQLDAFVARALAQPGMPVLMHLARHSDEPEATTYRPEIHGEMTLVAGAGSHGGSFYGGALTGIYDDPAHNFSIAATYAEIHSKGICVDPFSLAPYATANGPGIATEKSLSAQMNFGPVWSR
jgi:hypothetical protein